MKVARYNRALDFNCHYAITSAKEWLGAQWMCPHCNRVHDCTGHTKSSANQYPGCCNFEPGHRLFKAHAFSYRVQKSCI